MGSDPLRGLLALLGEFILEQDAIVYARERSLFFELDLAKLHRGIYLIFSRARALNHTF